MAILDDLIISGLSLPQAQAVVASDTADVTSALVTAGFSGTQAAGITGLNAGTASAANLAAQGLWAGTQVPAIEAALAVTA